MCRSGAVSNMGGLARDLLIGAIGQTHRVEKGASLLFGHGATLMATLMGVGLGLISGVLIWGGHQLLEVGRDVMVEERRFSVEYVLGSHFLWLLSGVVVAAILMIGSRPNAKGTVRLLLVAALVPVLMILSTYIWGAGAYVPDWLHRIATRPWLLTREVQGAAAVLAGVLLGTVLWRGVWPRTMLNPD
jgi:hypothetical protein